MLLGGANVGSIDRVQTQVTSEEGGRPDLVAFGDKGAIQVLIEAKFWAGLTPNQPNRYLEQLPSGRPAALLFIAPAKRLRMLWPKLNQRAKVEFELAAESVSNNVNSVIAGDEKHRLLLTSWATLLEQMRTKARSAGDIAAEADIQQLRGLADRMDADAFLPWRPVDLGPEFARRVMGLITLIDDVVNSGNADNFLGLVDI